MYDITIIGAGRVGLPLALVLEESGLCVAVKDRNELILNAIKNGKMPFNEPGFDDLIKNSEIETFNSSMPDSACYIITVGTPLNQHIETDLHYVTDVIDELITADKINGKLIILRSTVAPHTTEHVKKYIESMTDYIVGTDYFLAMCPERIAEGVAKNELKSLPQIIGTYDDTSFNMAKEVFSSASSVIKVSPLEAELSKLFCNIFRYINFAIPNYLAYIASTFGVEPHSLFDVIKKDYPRMDSLKSTGFTGGTCLRKDFGMINEHFPQTDLLLQAYKINEFMPKYLVDLVKDKLHNKKIGILGYTFKANTDDTRDTLVSKLYRYINREVPLSIMISEPNLQAGEYKDTLNNFEFFNYDYLEVIKDCDIIFIGTNHKEYSELDYSLFNNKIVVDIWRVLGKELVVYGDKAYTIPLSKNLEKAKEALIELISSYKEEINWDESSGELKINKHTNKQ